MKDGRMPGRKEACKRNDGQKKRGKEKEDSKEGNNDR